MPDEKYPEHAGRPMVSTKHTDRALQKAADDCPIFTLVGTDPTAPAGVQKWIDDNVKRLGFTHPKILSAIATRDAMMGWPVQRAAD